MTTLMSLHGDDDADDHEDEDGEEHYDDDGLVGLLILECSCC